MPYSSPEQARLYNSKRWKVLRVDQLRRHPLCRMCMRHGRIEAATVVDHVVPHRNDPKLFFDGELQSLCKPCHDKHKQQIEKRGFSKRIGLDGWPTDPNHPANRKR